MRCPEHVDRIADRCCGLCGSWTCEECALHDDVLAESICRACALSRTAGRARGTVVDPRASARAVSLPVALTAAAVLVAATVFALLVWDAQVEPVGTGPSGFDDRGELLVSAYQALETTGLALEAYRAQQGNYPDSLDVLVPGLLPKLPGDPFAPDGQPLVYLVAREGAQGRILYSRGPDRLDQRGLPMDPLSRTGDLLYPVE